MGSSMKKKMRGIAHFEKLRRKRKLGKKKLIYFYEG
jgi:hypothetical protein